MDANTVAELVGDLTRMHVAERVTLDRYRDFANGVAGRPILPDKASAEVKELARLAPKNVIGVVIDTFAQNLSVVGYRDAAAEANAPAWALWQAQRMDARQHEIHRAALTYGAAYAIVGRHEDGSPVWRTRTPRQVIAVYANPDTDEFPTYALESWTAVESGRRVRRGFLLDDVNAWPLELGSVPDVAGDLDGRHAADVLIPHTVDVVGRPVPHGGDGVCPVVRYVNRRDSESLVQSEVAPLITLQRAINNVNFDRLIVSRFGAHPQKVISGWSPASTSEALKTAANRVWTFEDEGVSASQLPGTDPAPYSAMLAEMMEHVAMVAQISPAQVTGKMVNLSAEALSAGEANQQRKLAAMRDSFGESHESLLQLGSRMAGVAAGDTASEVIWRDTEARTFAAVVDGVVKLAGVGVPIQHLLSLVPGVTQAQQVAIVEAMKNAPPASTPQPAGVGLNSGGFTPAP